MQCRNNSLWTRGVLLVWLCQGLAEVMGERLRRSGGPFDQRFPTGAAALSFRWNLDAHRFSDQPQDDLESWLARIFRCSQGDSGPAVFGRHVSIAQLFTVLAFVCLLVGLVSDSYAVARHYDFPVARKIGVCWRLKGFSDSIVFRIQCMCDVIGHAFVLLADVNIFVGFLYCQFYLLFATLLTFKIASNMFLAYEYAFSYPDEEHHGSVQRFFIAIVQLRSVQDTRDSIKRGEFTPSFLRQNFLDSVCDQAPQAIFMTYVAYVLDQHHNIFLVTSIVCKVVATAFAIAMWLKQSLQEQLIEDLIEAADLTARDGVVRKNSSSRHIFNAAQRVLGTCRPSHCGELQREEVAAKMRAIAMQAVKWYHLSLWICYFASDFGLRLLTLGLFLSTAYLKPLNNVVFLALIIAYSVVAVLAIGFSETSESFQVMDRQRVKQRAVDVFIVTFLVNVIPADIRRPPKDSDESRIMMSMASDVRDRLLLPVIVLRAMEYVALACTALWAHHDSWQFLALLSLFLTMHILLASVLVLQQKMSPIFDGSQDELTAEEREG